MCWEALDCIRREAERCDSVHGFQFVHSLTGGTGSGLGTLILCRLREEYPDRFMMNFSLVPSPHETSVVTETYNTIMAFHHLIENSDAVMLFDNEALFNITTNQLKIEDAQYEDINQLVATAMSNITASCRFPGCQLNTDFRKLCTNLIPYPRLHFFSVGMSPLHQQRMAVPEILQELLEFKNLFTSSQSTQLLTAGFILRGDVSQYEVESSLRKFYLQNLPPRTDWLGEATHYSTCPVTPPGYSVLGTLLANDSDVATIFRRIVSQFHAFFRRKAFLSHYTGAGMDEMEFAEAESNVSDLASEYHYQGFYDYEDEYEEALEEL